MLKKILYINSTAKMSGAEFSLLGLMAGLDKKSFQPLLLLPEPGPFGEKAVALGIEVLVLPSLLRFDERYRPWKILRVVRVVLAIRKMIRSRGISLVHSNKLGVSYSGGLAARLAGVPAVLHVRDSGLAGIIAPWKGRLLAALSDRVIAVSKAARNSIVAVHRLLEKKTTIIYNGIDLEDMDKIHAAAIREELSIPASAPLVGAVGRIEPGKGYDVLIDAAEALKINFPSLRLLVIGPVFEFRQQAYMDGLRQRVEEKNLANTVLFTGFRADVLEIIKALDVLVHPAVCPDSLPRAVLEAAAFGKPIVSSRVGGVPEILDDRISGILVEPGDAGALAAALASLLQDSAEARRLGVAAREKIEKFFTVSKHLASVVELYESLWLNTPNRHQTGGKT